MTENGENPEVEDKESLDYIKIKSTPVDELVGNFNKFSLPKKMELVTNFCLAKAMSEDAETGLKSEDQKLEYLKEFGRNGRALMKVEDPEGGEDDGLFPRPD